MEERIPQIIRQSPSCTEDEIAWKLIEEMSIKAATLLKPAFDRKKEKTADYRYKQTQGYT